MRISRSNKPRIVITMGDPSGIGPEVTLKALASPKVKGLADFLVIGEEFGRKGASSGRASLDYIDKALDIACAGEADAIVTAPVNKSSIQKAALPGFQGHTEYLAERTGTRKFAMMFVGERLKVTLVTRHIALRRVPGAITGALVSDAIALTYKYLKNCFGVKRPKIGVCGLNPHAGELGAFGTEEQKTITPAIRRCAKMMKSVYGPIPADAAFYGALNKRYDAVVAMYHDQALAPFKMLYFKSGVNLTLGLPFIRTSPDHGTAFDIAGKGVADPSSMIEAIRLACSLAGKRC